MEKLMVCPECGEENDTETCPDCGLVLMPREPMPQERG